MNQYKRICPCCGKELAYKYKSTYDKANKKNLECKSCAQLKRFKDERYGDLSILLDDTNEAFYWIGFLLADGSFSEYRLKIGISGHDIEHLKKFAKFIKYKKQIKINYFIKNNKEYSVCGLSVQNKIIVPQIKNKFDIHLSKTYNPPCTLNNWSRNLILSLFIGFIDGDGCIVKKTNRKDAKLGIQIHSSWLQILKEFSNIIFKKDYTCINANGYACLTIEEFPVIRRLKEEMLTLNIPFLERKWNRIDETYINKLEKGKILRPLIKNDFNNGLSRKEIQEKYNVSKALLTKILVYNK